MDSRWVLVYKPGTFFFPIYFVIPSRSQNSIDERRNLLALSCKWHAQTATATVTEEARQRTHVVRKISLKCNMYCSSSVFLCIETAVSRETDISAAAAASIVFFPPTCRVWVQNAVSRRTLKLFDFEEADTGITLTVIKKTLAVFVLHFCCPALQI